MNFIGVPQNAPAQSRAFRVLNAVLFIDSDNSNGTGDFPYLFELPETEALAWIVPFATINPGDIPVPGTAAPFPLASLGPAVSMNLIGHNEGAGQNRSVFVMDSNREIVVPFGYKFGVWVRDSADGTPHNLKLTLFTEIQWLEQDCEC
jgi:hypothetical protein